MHKSKLGTKTRWASVKLNKELSDRLDKIIVNATIKIRAIPFGIKTVILTWALEEWLEKYEDDPNLYDEIAKRLSSS